MAENDQVSAWKPWLIAVVFWSLGPALGWLVGCLTTFGSKADVRMFEAIGAAGPLVGLAVFVELVVVMGQLVSTQGATPANRALARSVIRANAGLLVTSEGLALYAIGAQTSSTFLVIAVLVPLLLQVYLLIDTAYQRVGASRIRGG